MTTIYHNPRCSKSRAALAILEQKGIDYSVVEYLKNPPTKKELADILSKLGISARTLIRKKEPIYKTEGLDNETLSENELVSAMVTHPILMERPIVVANGRAVIGRPPENVLAII